MKFDIVFSVIIPHRNSLDTLERLFLSIPNRDDIEIIVVDNSLNKISLEDLPSSRKCVLCYSEPNRGAGGARNVGIEHASGKWLLFADADDYYAPNAFDLFYSKVSTDADIVYTEMGGIYDDTGEPSTRGDGYVKLVQGFLNGLISEMSLRTHFHSPCCKMVRRKMVNEYNIRYSEVLAGNDAYFSMVSGVIANSIEVIDHITYIATVRRGSLTQRKDYPVFLSRYKEDLRINKFLREHNLSCQQYHVLGTILRSRRYGLRSMWECLKLAIINKQNIFVGFI